MSKISDILGKITDRTVGIYRKFGSAIILAAGSGSRAMTNGTTKQMIELLGTPVIARTVSEFEKCKFINEIIIVAKKDELPLYDGMTVKYGWSKVVAVVEGGDTRQESVLCGFKKINDKSKLVYIHDGARCLVTEEMIKCVGQKAASCGAAFAATKASDTVKLEGDKGISTLDREKIWLAQTPQVFLTELYRAAAYTGAKNGLSFTDDVSLAESVGFKTYPVECGKENIKITHPCDFAIAEAIISYRERKEGGN